MIDVDVELVEVAVAVATAAVFTTAPAPPNCVPELLARREMTIEGLDGKVPYGEGCLLEMMAATALSPWCANASTAGCLTIDTGRRKSFDVPRNRN